MSDFGDKSAWSGLFYSKKGEEVILVSTEAGSEHYFMTGHIPIKNMEEVFSLDTPEAY